MTLQDRFVKGEDQEQKEVQGETETVKEGVGKETGTKAENAEEQRGDVKMDRNKTEAGDQNTGKEERATSSEGGEDKENQV